MIDIEELKPAVEAQIAVEGGGATCVFGREYLYRRDGQATTTANRVVVAPGTPDGQEGQVLPPRHRNRTYPEAATHRRMVTVQVWGYDSTRPSDEATQNRSAEALFQLAVRAMQFKLQSSGHGHHGLYEAVVTYPIKPTERRHGDMKQMIFWVDFGIRAPFPSEVVAAEPDPVIAEVTTPSGGVVEES